MANCTWKGSDRTAGCKAHQSIKCVPRSGCTGQAQQAQHARSRPHLQDDVVDVLSNQGRGGAIPWVLVVVHELDAAVMGTAMGPVLCSCSQHTE
eukprot:scaffold167096_cov17-Tisochrysis_lutea.AAC.1